MGNVLVLVDQEEGKVSKIGLATIKAAKEIKDAWGLGSIVGIFLGKQASVAASSVGGCGIDSAVFSEAPDFEQFRAVAFAIASKEAFNSEGAEVFVTAANSNGRDFAPRLAAMLDAGQASDVIAINGDGTLNRPMYAGNVIATARVKTDKKVITVRPTAFDPVTVSGNLDQTKEIKVSIDPSLAGEIVGYDRPESERPELSDASVVVSGGRAMQSEENFKKYIYPLADSLGAAIGASRAAVDSGYAPNDWQVGQTGKVVAPDLYIAVGISGAIQHLAGMKDSKIIVAINKDPDAPIFEVADYGLVADLYEVIDPLTEAFKAAKS